MIERIGPVESVSRSAFVDATVRKTDRSPTRRPGASAVLRRGPRPARDAAGSVARAPSSTRRPRAIQPSSLAQRPPSAWASTPGVRVWLGGRVVHCGRDPGAPRAGHQSRCRRDHRVPGRGGMVRPRRHASTIYVRADPERSTRFARSWVGRRTPRIPTRSRWPARRTRSKRAPRPRPRSRRCSWALGAVALDRGWCRHRQRDADVRAGTTFEIGLRRALGATRRHIALQFVAEALILAVPWRRAGRRAGDAVGVGYALYSEWTPVVPPVAFGGRAGQALAIGAIAGLYPSHSGGAGQPHGGTAGDLRPGQSRGCSRYSTAAPCPNGAEQSTGPRRSTVTPPSRGPPDPARRTTPPAYVPGSSVTVNGRPSPPARARGTRCPGWPARTRSTPGRRAAPWRSGRSARRSGGCRPSPTARARRPRTDMAPPWLGRPADQAEVHQDRVVAAQERLPRPQRVALAGRVVVGVADDHLGAVGSGRIGEPA